ncbi:RNA polymerase sigma-70 factor [Chitinophaga niabensis]|uniref:RNA polymerase sigma-70 factor, ECF subfamily n=1 Tax=Chitinophaga niabensis TaxID=536979 RepID=A0A1N6H3Y6_9BACT|nr:RNA polymerase sigma-70 factor [Chitinophaga niabensis]SIO14466.1 RNA polymerase sigma-70 factor, ECF subfamily [Chitinophaga niabensis]
MQEDFTDIDALLSRLKMHDLEAFTRLYKLARGRLYILANAIIQDSAAAQDLVQELFMELWERRIYLNIQTSLKAYLIRSVRNKAYNYLDKQGTQARLSREYLRIEQYDTSPLEKLELAALGQDLERAISKLPPMAAKVFHLHYIEKLSHAAIAEQLQISKHTVSGHIDRALKQLREDLKKIKN